MPVLASRAEIAKRIKTHLGVGSETIDGLMAQIGDDRLDLTEGAESDDALSELAQEPSVVRLVNEILLEAIESRASDVHIESQQSGLRIRYRIDGVLHAQPTPAGDQPLPGGDHQPLEDHVAAEHRRAAAAPGRPHPAQGGRPRGGHPRLGHPHDPRRRHRAADPRQGIDAVLARQARHGAGPVRASSSELIRLPHGIILVTGPTGSGKSTTLYSALLEIKSDETKIITTEDPVEYQLEGINQIQVHPKIGLTFGHSLRSILRHDPDIILVGEIRDLETAENAIQASLTGHLVFSTLHTNDAAGAYTRLVDMGVEPFLVSSTVEAVMAQRLVRVLVPALQASPYQPDGRRAAAPIFPREPLAGGRCIGRSAAASAGRWATAAGSGCSSCW